MGKSRLALAVARAHGDVEIVSLDSMQVYRGMDIGTAKVSADERAEIPHHLIDVVDPDESWSVAAAQAQARGAVADIEARGKSAILVGGTGLYVQAVLDDLSLPGEDLAVRAELEAATSEPGGLLAAWNELRARDPLAASRIDEHNQRRIVRALEVIRITGEPFSSFGNGVFGATQVIDALMIGLWCPRDQLAERITQRFVTMRDGGLLEEVRRLAPVLSRNAAQAIGYKELLACVAANALNDESLDAAFDLSVRRTKSFARRQRMWFRRDPRITWLWGGVEKLSALTDATLACWSATP